MKKFISFVMAAAMVASLVPATAFAAGEVNATVKVVDAKDLKKDETVVFNGKEGPEAQLKITNVDYQASYSKLPTVDVTVKLDNAEFNTQIDGTMNNPANTGGTGLLGLVAIRGGQTLGTGIGPGGPATNVYSIAADLASATGLATVAADGTATMPAGYTTVAAIKALIKPAMTAAQQIDDYKAQGYTLSSDGTTLNKPGQPPVTIASLTDKPAVTWDTLTTGSGAYASHTHFVKHTSTPATDGAVTGGDIMVAVKPNSVDKDEVTYTFTGFFAKDTVIAIDLDSTLTKTSVGTKATVSVDSKMGTGDDMTYATIVDKGIKASIKKTIDIAEEEVSTLYSKGLVIEPSIKDSYKAGDVIELKLSSGFEFTKTTPTVDASASGAAADWKVDGNTATFTIPALGTNQDMIVKGIEIESTSAKSGAVATMKVTAKSPKAGSSTTFTTIGTASVEVAKVVDYKVILSVDADEDVPVIYSGVNVDNYGLTDDSDHLSLEVTSKETFPGAWSMRQGFNFTLPDGVYVTDVKVLDTENFYNTVGSTPVEASATKWENEFYNAYQKGDHKNFEFVKRVFDDVNTKLTNDIATVTFQLELVADPTFEGDVVLGLEGDLLDKQEVTIAKFVKPYIAKAEQNDVIIDYRNTAITTPITVTEAEAGLWSENEVFTFTVDRGDMIQFEKDTAKFVADEKSSMEVKDKASSNDGTLKFAVKEESEDSAATVTINEIELFMQRNVPAGNYELTVNATMNDAYNAATIFAADEGTFGNNVCSGTHNKDKDCTVGDVNDYEKTVKESFVNVITAGRDQDDASFTTKIVVPVGEKYLIAGETKVDLEVAAYISAAGYTMLPVRAVATALGINNNNVLWNAESRTITILYGQRIITMVVGQKIVNVNGSAIPTSASPEIKEGRAFLPMRDLATALGVTDITWDQATKTATMNGSK